MTNKKNSILKIASRPRRLKDRSGDMEESRDKGLNEGYAMPPRTWFLTFMCMNIPIIGWIYLLTKAFGKKDNPLKDFSRAYLLYKLVFLIVALVILGIVAYIGLGILDELLAYMEML